LAGRRSSILQREPPHWIILGITGQDKVRAEPFDATALQLARLWAD
jgi:hypothetical protein